MSLATTPEKSNAPVSPSYISPSSKHWTALSIEEQTFRAINLARKNPSFFIHTLDTYRTFIVQRDEKVEHLIEEAKEGSVIIQLTYYISSFNLNERLKKSYLH